MKYNFYQAIVVGAGHAGCEAAYVLAKMGIKTLLITINLDHIAQMSCNPAIGGSAKGQMVREIDALGGIMGRLIDRVGIQFRMLNTSKGPAVWAPRAQADKKRYIIEMRKTLENTENLTIIQDNVIEILADNSSIKGVKTKRGNIFYSDGVIITAGTFLNGLIHIGSYREKAGRLGDEPSPLSDSIANLGFEVGRLKTGTPARIDGNSIDFSKMERQENQEINFRFSHFTTNKLENKVYCYITYTNERTHEIIRQNLKYSPLYGEKRVIRGIGPRYCPSIEDKVVKFPDRSRHQLFVEPEGLDTTEYYINGFSTSLPESVQVQMYHTVSGLENAILIRPAYAIEYDFFPPHQLKPTLETKLIENLYFAGQVNGTSGYEEAAGQGIVAGINLALKLKGKKPFIMTRAESYIGVMIDDLITKGVDEPYRMMSSRSEYRLIIRNDNADRRLIDYGYSFGLINTQEYNMVKQKLKKIDELKEKLKTIKLKPNNNALISRNINIKNSMSIANIIKGGNIDIDFLRDIGIEEDFEVMQRALIEIKYEGYINRQIQQVKRFNELENKKIPQWIDYNKIPGLLTEARQKLEKIRPQSIGQAMRIPGVNPSDIAVLISFIKR